MKYLDPKADLTFKKVFGEHPDLVKSFLNALLPLDEGDLIEEIEYLPAELVPENPLKKNSIVDVQCRDNRGRCFIVEMQMVWSPEFEQRVLFNASKAYVRQLGKGETYDLLHPVYSLCLVNDIFMREDSNFYHVFKMLHVEHSDRVIEGLQLVFIELPKFKPQKMGDKKMAVLWLRYLTEIDEKTKHAPIEMLDDPEVNKALNVIEESAFSDAQLRGYEKFWDGVSVERTLYNGGWKQGKKEGREEGLREGRKEGIIVGIKEGREEGRKKGSEEERLKNAKALKELGVSFEIITKVTGLTLTEIIAL